MSDLKQWEYYVETFGSAWKGANDEDLLAVLAELGQAGWEVFNVEQLRNSLKVRIVARRPIASSVHKHQTWP